MSEAVVKIQTPLGRLTWDARLSWWNSDPIPVPLLGGATTSISLSGQEQDPAAPIDADVLQAVSAFLALSKSSLDEIEPHVWQEYVDIREEFADEEGFPKFDRADLWRQVQLNGISVDKRHKDDLVYVNIECNCDWELEHGLQLVLQSGVRWVRVSDYSGHLTEGDHYGCPELDAWMHEPGGKLPVRSREEIFALLGKYKRGKR